ncbi:hypothetical protein [Chryseobacterium gambrini]|uniref:hypothetical protein n=1 Tax=Chryseobacterium gambrini TaxID=373672 RepID=UPI0011155DEF|nr:hypothetical protein [Chryseobacterium gambrini]
MNVNNEGFNETGKFNLKITNIDQKSFKIPKIINFCNIRLVALEFYNEESQAFEKANLANKDIDCFAFKDKSRNLQPNKNHFYEVNMKSEFEVLQSEKFFDSFKNRKYRFKVSFPLDSYNQCGESNILTTEWIYKN